MIRSLRHTLWLTLLLTCTACEKDSQLGYNPPETAEQTILLYMPGRGLLGYYEHNIEGIRRAMTRRAPGNGRMLVCYQPQSHSSAVLQEIYYDTAKKRSETITLKTYDSFNAGQPEDVRQLFADAETFAPAHRYGLIIGCHGKAWVPAANGAIPYSAQRLAENDMWTPAPGAKPTRSFGDTGYELDITELAGVLEALRLRFDYLVFDDCFMANIETLYDLRHAVDYVVASPCEIMGAGFPYERIVPLLFADESTKERLAKSCRAFYEFYQNDWASVPNNEQSGCISLAVMAELDALAAEMRRINQSGKQSFDISRLQTYKGGSTPLFYDLGHYVLNSCGDPALIDDFNTALDRAFPLDSRLHTDQFYSAYNDRLNPVFFYTGVSVSEPSTAFAAQNRQTTWYRDTH